ncbi:hypothetical protein CASFOL_033781 [Castilleja foliolosa]|uniref:Peptidase A1 domain-containing protein n=1 Tax=Castilleja foliolosa TaxID=1961234 RepID=A0ABD3BXX8_9LAMI
MAITMTLHPISLASIALILIFSISRFDTTKAAGFTIDLIHRDSIQSPSLYTTTSERVRNSLQRSFNHVKTLAQPQSTSTQIVPDRGEYLMKFSLGTPGVETLAIADTGSDLTWVQCQPCIKCFDQKSPIFDPQRSSTYKPAPCTSELCETLPNTSCSKNKTCSYAMMYGDSSSSEGDIAVETITLGGNVSIGNLTIGCGHLDQGTFGAGSSGIVGLGGGKVSLISQMGPSIKGKFSYCLVPTDESSTPSKMNFGENGVVTGDGVVSTPIVTKTPSTYYFLTLEGITVGSQRLNINLTSSSDGEGNIVIDSGTTLTFLPIEFYSQVETAVRSQMSLTETSDPQKLLKLCYIPTGDEDPKVPEMTAHFKGADVKLKTVNTFIKTTAKSICLAFMPAINFPIYGNLAQMDFLVGYDLEKKIVSFKPTDCSKA